MPGVNNDLGYLYADQGKNLEKAESMIRKAIQEEPDNAGLPRQPGLGPVQAGQGSRRPLEPLEKAVELQKPRTEGRRPRRDDPRAPGRRLSSSSRRPTKAKADLGEAEEVAAKAVPADKRLPEIRKKLESLWQARPRRPARSPATDP